MRQISCLWYAQKLLLLYSIHFSQISIQLRLNFRIYTVYLSFRLTVFLNSSHSLSKLDCDLNCSQYMYIRYPKKTICHVNWSHTDIILIWLKFLSNLIFYCLFLQNRVTTVFMWVYNTWNYWQYFWIYLQQTFSSFMNEFIQLCNK